MKHLAGEQLPVDVEDFAASVAAHLNLHRVHHLHLDDAGGATTQHVEVGVAVQQQRRQNLRTPLAKRQIRCWLQHPCWRWELHLRAVGCHAIRDHWQRRNRIGDKPDAAVHGEQLQRAASVHRVAGTAGIDAFAGPVAPRCCLSALLVALGREQC